MTRQDWDTLLTMLRDMGLRVAGVDYQTGIITVQIPQVKQ